MINEKYEKALEQGLTKKCSKCDFEGTVDMFGRGSKGSLLGANSMCKACKKLYTSKPENKARDKDKRIKRKEKDPEKFKKRGKNYRDNHKEEIKISTEKRRKENKEKINERQRYNYHKDIELTKNKKREYYKNNAKTLREKYKIWKNNNKDKVEQYKQNFIDKHGKEYIADRSRQWHLENKERRNEDMRQHYQNNKSYYTNKSKARLQGLKTRMISSSSNQFINVFYHVSSRLTDVLGEQFHVDHIIPLNGINISGFHHQANLQVISATANLRKGNKY